MRALLIALAWLSTAFAPAIAQDAGLPPPAVTPADLSVGCYLFVRDVSIPKDDDGHNAPYSAETCGLIGVMTMGMRSGPVEGEQFRFCMSHTAENDANPAFAMAYAYLDFYRANAARITTNNGPSIFVLAMVDKWPCQ